MLTWLRKKCAKKVKTFNEFKSAVNKNKHIYIESGVTIFIHENIIIPENIKIYCDGRLLITSGKTLTIKKVIQIC